MLVVAGFTMVSYVRSGVITVVEANRSSSWSSCLRIICFWFKSALSTTPMLQNMHSLKLAFKVVLLLKEKNVCQKR